MRLRGRYKAEQKKKTIPPLGFCLYSGTGALYVFLIIARWRGRNLNQRFLKREVPIGDWVRII